MKKKIRWGDIFREVSSYQQDGRENDEMWQRLLDVSNSFGSCRDVCDMLNPSGKWLEAFLDKMIEKIRRSSDWRVILEFSKVNSKKWKLALEKAYENTKSHNTAHCWQQFLFVLPRDHELRSEASENLRKIRRDNRIAKKKKK